MKLNMTVNHEKLIEVFKILSENCVFDRKKHIEYVKVYVNDVSGILQRINYAIEIESGNEKMISKIAGLEEDTK